VRKFYILLNKVPILARSNVGNSRKKALFLVAGYSMTIKTGYPCRGTYLSFIGRVKRVF
jgi:hypothetical protein